MAVHWTVAPEWKGETAFIVAGGPSVAGQDVDLLRGRRVIALNSSFAKVPFADMSFFGDARWWNEYGKQLLACFEGRIATSDPIAHERVLRLKKVLPPGLAADRSSVALRRTSLTAGINLAVHLGAASIILLGADGRADAAGNTHHHQPYPWNQMPCCWDDQKHDLRSLVGPLQDRGVRVINASPGSAIEFWPVMTLERALGLGI